ncbi:protein FAM219B isoform X1 [Mus pahari]|uniref:protein FAM219B isoform X1 n=1 Tax=Mus pahari TaxID=10093 RepID=UPI001114F273|nr:protein FAM219B isoform X1 [Mus pahari]
MATGELRGHAVRISTQGSQPGAAPDSVAGTAGLPSGQSGGAALRLGERPPPAMEKRGPYLVTRAPSIQAKLKKHRDHAKAVLRRKGMLGALTNRPDSSGKRSHWALLPLYQQRSKKALSLPAWETGHCLRSVKFNKGYTALSQSPDENLVSLDSDSDGELESRYSSGYSSAEQVNQDVSRQLLQDGYHLDEIPDDEDLDLIPPKPIASSACSCCWCCLGDSSCTLQ